MLISKLCNPLKTWSHGVVNIPGIWLGLFDYFVGSGLKGLTYVCMHVCFHAYIFCFVIFCMYIVWIYMYTFTYMYICMCVYIYIYVCWSVYIYASLYAYVGTHFCLYKSYLFNCLSCRYLGCYLSVWHCYLGSILAFSFEIVKLNTITCTWSSTQVIQINLGNMRSLFPTLIVHNSDCMYLFIWINSVDR